MSTIDEVTANKIIKDGLYVDETRYVLTYENMFGGKSWATIGWRENPGRYHMSEACHNIQEIWRHPKETLSLLEAAEPARKLLPR